MAPSMSKPEKKPFFVLEDNDQGPPDNAYGIPQSDHLPVFAASGDSDIKTPSDVDAFVTRMVSVFSQKSKTRDFRDMASHDIDPFRLVLSMFDVGVDTVPLRHMSHEEHCAFFSDAHKTRERTVTSLYELYATYTLSDLTSALGNTGTPVTPLSPIDTTVETEKPLRENGMVTMDPLSEAHQGALMRVMREVPAITPGAFSAMIAHKIDLTNWVTPARVRWIVEVAYMLVKEGVVDPMADSTEDVASTFYRSDYAPASVFESISDTICAAVQVRSTMSLFDFLTNTAAPAVESWITDYPIMGYVAGLFSQAGLYAVNPTTMSSYLACSYSHRYAGRWSSTIADDMLQFLFLTRTAEGTFLVDEAGGSQRRSFWVNAAIATLKRQNYLMRYAEKYTVELPLFSRLRIAMCCALGTEHADALAASDPQACLAERVTGFLEFASALTQQKISPATPTQCYAGSPRQSRFLSSCFLIPMFEDSVLGIAETNTLQALTSKCAGGTAYGLTTIRGAGSRIFGTRGESNGVCPMFDMFSSTNGYIGQGKNIRKGASAFYLDISHSDIPAYIRYRNPSLNKPKQVYTGICIRDVFLEKVDADEDWYLFCPTTATRAYQHLHPDLSKEDIVPMHDLSNEAYAGRYHQVCEVAKAWERDPDVDYKCTKIRVRELWNDIITQQTQSGFPYIIQPDCATAKNMQGMQVRQSNLCTEIMEFTTMCDPITGEREYAVCNLMTLVVSRFTRRPKRGDVALLRDRPFRLGVKFEDHAEAPYIPDGWDVKRRAHTFEDHIKVPTAGLTHGQGIPFTTIDYECRDPGFDYEAFGRVTRVATRMINGAMRRTSYAIKEYRRSNERWKSVGLGVQGLVDAMIERKIPYGSKDGFWFERSVFAHLNYQSVSASVELASQNAPYPAFALGAWAKGKLSHDLWFEEIQNRKMVRDTMEKLDIPQRDNADDQFYSGVEKLEMLDFPQLRVDVKEKGVYNSLHQAPPPTATSAFLLDNTEGTEPLKKVVERRKVMTGEILFAKTSFAEHLSEMGLLTSSMTEEVRRVGNNADLVPTLDDVTRCLFRSAYHMSQFEQTLHSYARGPPVEQSSSNNCFVSRHTSVKEVSHWSLVRARLGIKTVVYYCKMEGAFDGASATASEGFREDMRKAATNGVMRLNSGSTAPSVASPRYALVTSSAESPKIVVKTMPSTPSMISSDSEGSEGKPRLMSPTSSASTGSLTDDPVEFVLSSGTEVCENEPEMIIACPLDPAKRAECEACQS